jgi:hypothetical protein
MREWKILGESTIPSRPNTLEGTGVPLRISPLVLQPPPLCALEHLTYAVPTREAATFWSGFVGHSRGAHKGIGCWKSAKGCEREARKDAGTTVGVLVTSDSFVLSRGTDATILNTSWRQ